MYRLLLCILIALSASLVHAEYLNVNDFTGGINTRTAPDKIKDNQAVDITNMDFGIQGSLEVRSGVIKSDLTQTNVLSYTGTANGLIRAVILGGPGYDPRYQDSISSNTLYLGNSDDLFAIIAVDFSGILSLIPSSSSIVTGDWSVNGIGSGGYLYFTTTNIDINTVTRDSLTMTSTRYIMGLSDIPSERYTLNLSDVLIKLKSEGKTTMLSQGVGRFKITDWTTSVINLKLVLSSNVRNIDDKESNAYMFSNYIKYSNKTKLADVNYYTNSLKNIYFFGNNNYTWNDYTSSFTNLGYSSPYNVQYSALSVSGNLNGAYNYAVTNVYDNAFESNPVLGQAQTSTTQNYTFGSFFLRVGGFNYAFQQIGAGLYLTKTTTGNVFVASKYLMDQKIFKAIATSQNIFFSTEEGYIYKYDLNMNQLGYYTNVNVAGYVRPGIVGDGDTWRNPQFSIVDGKILTYKYIIVFGVGPFYAEIFFTYLDLNLNLISDLDGTLISFGSDIPDRSFSVSDINKFGSIYWNKSGSFYVSRFDTVLYSPLNANAMGNVRGLDFGTDNSFYNNNYQKINVYSPLVYTLTSINFLIASSDIIAGFDNAGTKVYLSNTSLNSLASSLNSYLTSINFSVLNGQMNVVIPTSDSNRVTARKLYRQKSGTGYYLLANINDNQTTTYVDNISDAQLSVLPLNYDNNTPPSSMDGVYTHARLFYLDNNGTIWYSKLNAPEAIPSLNYIPINNESSDLPMRLVSMYDGLFIFFQKSIYYIDLSNSNTLTWVPRKLNTDFGCPYPNSITKGKFLNDSIGLFYMASDKSIRALNGVGKESIQLFDNIATDYFSEGIQNELNLITDNVNDIYCTYFDYALYVSIPSLKTVYVWDAHVNGWTKYVYPIAFKYIGVADNMLLAGDYNTSTLYQLDGDSTTDLGTPISYNYTSKIYPSNYFIQKNYQKLWVRGNQTDSGLFKIKTTTNYDDFPRVESMNVNLKSTANITTRAYNLISGKGRDFQFQITGTPNIVLNAVTTRFVNADE